MSVNRSEEIRRFFDQNPGARPKECITALAALGIDVSPTLVSCVRAKLKERSVPVRDMAADLELVGGFVDSSGLDPEVAVEILSRFAGVVEQVGGLDRFREVLAAVDPSQIGRGGGPDDDPEPVNAPLPVEPTPVPEPTPTPTPVLGASVVFYDDVNDDEDDD